MKANNYTGKNFEWEIRKSLDDISCWWFRIQDTNDVSRFVKKAIAEKQPGDFFAVKDGTPILIECKTSRNKTSFPLFYNKNRAIPEHQIKYAKDLVKEGGQAWFFIRKDIPRNKRVFALTPQKLDESDKNLINKMIKKFLNQLKDLETGHIDLDELLSSDRDRAVYEKWIEVFNIMSPMDILQSLSTINNSIKMSKRDEIILLAYTKFFEQKMAMIGSLPQNITDMFGKQKKNEKKGSEYDGQMFG